MESIMSAIEPIRETEGADIVGPRNADRERQNPFTVRSPASDHGTTPNLKWSFADNASRSFGFPAVRSDELRPSALPADRPSSSAINSASRVSQF